LPEPLKGTPPEKVEPPNTRLDELLLLRPFPDVVIDPPFIVSVNPEKSRLPLVSAIVPPTVRFDPSATVPDLVIVKLFRNSEPEVNVNVPKVPLPLNVRLDVAAPPMVPDVTVKTLCTLSVFPLPIMNEPDVNVSVPTTFVTPTLLLVTPFEFAITKFTLEGNPFPNFCALVPL